MFTKSTAMVSPEQALPGREQAITLGVTQHFVNHHEIVPPWASQHQQAMFGMGCFWGAEKLFWQIDGVYVTAVGYAGGYTPNANYQEVCTGMTGHNEVVLVVFDPTNVKYETLLTHFWQGHDPTQLMRQGNDVGSQYRSGIYSFSEQQQRLATQSKEGYQAALSQQAYADIQTEILPAPTFYYAESDHQQYLAKHVNGYCGLGGTGVTCPG